MDIEGLSREIKMQGKVLGFDLVGISRAVFLEQEAKDLERWLNEGRQGKMEYMENYFDLRTDPRKLVPGAQSVISVIHNYFPAEEHSMPPEGPKISRYAWGEDYHTVLKRKLYLLFEYIRERVSMEIQGRVFVDSAPVMDKAWARRSGLGWIGKHTNLIVPKKGSYFFIGEIILDLALEYDGPIKDYCGTCTRCIDACPTDALSPYQIDATKCISYLTIELKENLPESYRDKMDGWIFGCDICQEVCPWNRFSEAHDGTTFRPLKHAYLGLEEWEELTESTFRKLVKRTPLSRVRRSKLMDSISVYKIGKSREDTE